MTDLITILEGVPAAAYGGAAAVLALVLALAAALARGRAARPAAMDPCLPPAVPAGPAVPAAPADNTAVLVAAAIAAVWAPEDGAFVVRSIRRISAPETPWMRAGRTGALR